MRSHRSTAESSRADWRRRAALAALALMLSAPAANASDDWFPSSWNPFGSRSYNNWEGYNFGVHAAQSSLNANYDGATQNLLGTLLAHDTVEVEDGVSSWRLIDPSTTSSASYGAFLGYNFQMEQIVYGFDLAYNRLASLQTSSSGGNGWLIHTSNGYDNTYLVSGDASIRLIDYATVRGRIGYAFGQFLPYATAGVAVGRFDYTRSVTVSLSGTDVSGGGGLPYSFAGSISDAKNGAVVGGFTLGVGLDVAVTPNIFVRGEYEFAGFAEVGGIQPTMNTGRVGVGLKF